MGAWVGGQVRMSVGVSVSWSKNDGKSKFYLTLT